MFGGIEAGGTKFVCGIGTGPDDLKTAQFPTSTPDITVASAIDFSKPAGRNSMPLASDRSGLSISIRSQQPSGTPHRRRSPVGKTSTCWAQSISIDVISVNTP
jgi:hypothetical protein